MAKLPPPPNSKAADRPSTDDSITAEVRRALEGTHEQYIERLNWLVEEHEKQVRVLRKRKYERLRRVQRRYEAELKQAEEEFELNRQEMQKVLVEEIRRGGESEDHVSEGEFGILTRKKAAERNESQAAGRSGGKPVSRSRPMSFRQIKIVLEREEVNRDFERLKKHLQEDDVPFDVHLGSRQSKRMRRSRPRFNF